MEKEYSKKDLWFSGQPYEFQEKRTLFAMGRLKSQSKSRRKTATKREVLELRRTENKLSFFSAWRKVRR